MVDALTQAEISGGKLARQESRFCIGDISARSQEAGPAFATLAFVVATGARVEFTTGK